MTIDFRQSVYPFLADLEFESNNEVCAVKEIFSRFVNDKYIRARINASEKHSYVAQVIMEISVLVEEHAKNATKRKQEFVASLAHKFEDLASQLDDRVSRLYPSNQNRGQAEINFVKERLDLQVFKYNEMAEVERKKQHNQERMEVQRRIIFNMIENLQTANFTEDSNQEPAPVGEPKHEKVIRQRQEGAFTSSLQRRLSLSTTITITDQNQSVVNDVQPPAKTPTEIEKPADNPQTEMTEEEFQNIVKNTRLSEPEDIKIEGLSQHNLVIHIEPSCEDKILFSMAVDHGVGIVTQDMNFINILEKADGSKSSSRLCVKLCEGERS